MKKYSSIAIAAIAFASSGNVYATSDMEVGEIVGKYVGGALFIQKIANRCPAFSKNRITMESAYRSALSALPERLSSELSKPRYKDFMAEMSASYESQANQMVAQYKDALNEDTRCGLMMGIALSIYLDGKTRLEKYAAAR